MIKQVFFFNNGNVAAFDAQGNQVPQWQINLHQVHLRLMVEEGIITPDAEISFQCNGRKTTLRELLPQEPEA